MVSGQRAVSKILLVITVIAIIALAGATVLLSQSNQPRPETTRPEQPKPELPKQQPADAGNAPLPRVIVIKAVSRTEFNPSFVNIPVGSTIIWENMDDEVHTATSKNFTASDSPLFHAVLNPGDKFQFKFDQPGTYYYDCVIAFHEMNGIIRVSR